ncbi:MAG: Glutathione S-transferase GST-6.0 [Stenotrophomonas maltophilia]|nr:MAG: Glutathione S-transferase GST-6.0 [Stenotrophomonas maltophilia]
MKLYYAPRACSLASHIALRETGLAFELVRVNNQTKRTEHDEDYLTINPKGYVAALKLDDGSVLTEAPALLQYIADLRPEAGLLAAPGSLARVRQQEWLAFVNSEVHGNMTPLFYASTLPQPTSDFFRARLTKRLDYAEQALHGREWLGERFSVSDAYLFTVLGWTAHLGIDLAQWPALQAFVARVEARPAVQAALQAEG